MTPEEFLKHKNHLDTAYSPTAYVERMLQEYSDQENTRLTAIVSKQDEMIDHLKTKPDYGDAIEKYHYWNDKRRFIESELEKLKAE